MYSPSHTIMHYMVVHTTITSILFVIQATATASAPVTASASASATASVTAPAPATASTTATASLPGPTAYESGPIGAYPGAPPPWQGRRQPKMPRAHVRYFEQTHPLHGVLCGQGIHLTVPVLRREM